MELTQYDKFRRELLVRKYSQSSMDTYISCLKVIIEKTNNNLSLESIKDFIITVNNRSYHKQIVATVRNYDKSVLKKE